MGFYFSTTMKLHIKYDIHFCCKIVLQEQLDKLQLHYSITGLGEVEIKGNLPTAQYNELEMALKKYGIEIIDNPKYVLVQKIKDAIVELVYLKETLPLANNSAYLAEKLNKAYNYLSDTFAQVTLTSIQSYIIYHRIERTKQLIIEGELNVTEIAWKLNYSSVAHLSNEFKKITGLTPTGFQRIIGTRKETDINNPGPLVSPLAPDLSAMSEGQTVANKS